MYWAKHRSAKTPHPRRSTRGVSVVEALTAIAFLGVGLCALAVNSIAGTHRVKNSDSIAAAHALAQQRLEQLRSMPLGSQPEHTPGQYYDPANNLKADGTSGGKFNRSWQVSLRDTPRFGLKTITVTVSWNDGTAHSTKMAAYVRCPTIPCTS